MGLLAIPRMLCLTVSLGFMLIETSFCENTFFNSKIDFFDKEPSDLNNESCLSCSEPALTPKVNPLNKAMFSLDKSIDLFIDPHCDLSVAAVKTMRNFKEHHPDWNTKIYAISSWEGFKRFASERGEDFSPEIPLAFDMENKYADKFSVSFVPAFVIRYEGSVYKIAGQPFLEQTIAKLAKK